MSESRLTEAQLLVNSRSTAFKSTVCYDQGDGRRRLHWSGADTVVQASTGCHLEKWVVKFIWEISGLIDTFMIFIIV